MRRPTATQQLASLLRTVLLTTARRAADAAAQSVIDDARIVAAETLQRLRVLMPSAPPPKPQHVDITARVVTEKPHVR